MLHFRPHPSFALGLLGLLGPSLAAQSSPGLAVPVVLEERTGLDQPAWPVVLGVPLPEGQLDALVPFEVLAGELALPAEGQVLSRWEDGSIRWMRVEFVAPAIAAGDRFSGILRLRQAETDLAGTLSVEAAPGAPLSAATGLIEIKDALGAGELFLLRASQWPLLDGAAAFEVETAEGLLLPLEASGFEVERQSGLSLVLRRTDQLLAPDGNPSMRLTTRLTLYRGSGLLRFQQSLDVLRGVHEIRGWRLILPLDDPGSRTWAPLEEGRMSIRRGDAEIRQTALDTYYFQGKPRDGAFPGVVACGKLTVGLRLFSQLFPTSMSRRGDQLMVDFCPGDERQAEVLEEGFGRTVELWIRAGTPRAAELHALAAMLAKPPLPHSTADWYLATEAFGRLGAALPGDHARLEERIAQSTDRVFLKRDQNPKSNFGIRHFGDFFDREHSVGYFGSLQQEYDPGLVLFQQFLRTGDVDYLEPAMELAWHYADVDMTPYGGAFQHRATKHHVDAWIAGIFASDLELEYQASPYNDGSLAGALAWVESKWGAAAATTLDGWIAIERERGLPESALQDRLFRMIGFQLLGHMEQKLPVDPEATLEDYAELLALEPEARARGYTSADRDFEAFFQRYGGSWEDFPSFHVDTSPVPEQRHQSGHSLVQSVALGHLLSGEPRLRQRALAFGRHHTTELVPRAIDTLLRLRDKTDDPLYTRTVAWPIVNLDTLVDLSCGMPGEQAQRDEMLTAIQECTDTLLTVPIGRIRSSIHAGMTLEGLTQEHQRTGDPAVADYLKKLARQWARDQYDWSEHAFRYRAQGQTPTFYGMSGLLLYGMTYAEQLEHDEDLWAVIQDAWQHLPQETSYAKSFAMLYRGAPRTLALMRILNSARP